MADAPCGAVMPRLHLTVRAAWRKNVRTSFTSGELFRPQFSIPPKGGLQCRSSRHCSFRGHVTPASAPHALSLDSPLSLVSGASAHFFRLALSPPVIN